MAKKNKAARKSLTPKNDRQISISRIRPVQFLTPRYYLQNAREYPIFGCWVHQGWREAGITPVIIARQQSDDKVIFCNCMVDLYCLGVKDAFADADIPVKHFRRELVQMCHDSPEECSPEVAHELIYGSIEFATRYGFQPSPDFKKQMADLVLAPLDAYPRNKKIKFGRKGKPFYIAGPYDDAQRVYQILDTLIRTAGEGKFDYLVSSERYESSNLK
jgi:hypothetical protein